MGAYKLKLHIRWRWEPKKLHIRMASKHISSNLNGWKWDLRYICGLVKERLEFSEMVEEIDQTNIVLIPKVDAPSCIKVCRLISLCDVSFKIITCRYWLTD